MTISVHERISAQAVLHLRCPACKAPPGRACHVPRHSSRPAERTHMGRADRWVNVVERRRRGIGKMQTDVDGAYRCCCRKCECDLIVEAEDMRSAKRLAHADGWATRDKRWHCPSCKTGRKAVPPAAPVTEMTQPATPADDDAPLGPRGSGQVSLAIDIGAPDFERLKEHEAFFTPGAIPLQGMQWLAGEPTDEDPERLGLKPGRVLDLMAGAGVFSQQAAKVWPDAHRIGVELREEERPHLERNADEVIIGDLLTAKLPMVDLAVGNPAFSLIREVHARGMGLLNPAGVLMLLVPTQALQRGEEKTEWFAEHTPWIELRIPGSINFRGPGVNPENGKKWGVDALCYSWLVWSHDQPGGSKWTTYQLPWLPGTARRWHVKPGTESA